jgi:hypothetical protein
MVPRKSWSKAVRVSSRENPDCKKNPLPMSQYTDTLSAYVHILKQISSSSGFYFTLLGKIGCAAKFVKLDRPLAQLTKVAVDDQTIN